MTNDKALLEAAQKASQQKNWVLAAQCWRACIEAQQDGLVDSSWIYAFGVALLYSGCSLDAKEAFSKLTSRHPEIPHGYLGLARAFHSEGDWQSSLNNWEICIYKFPDSSQQQAWKRARAGVLERLGRWPDALSSWEEMAFQNGDDQSQLGCTRCIEQMPASRNEKEKSVERILSRYPSNRHALRLSALLAQRDRDLDTAIPRWVKYIEHCPEDLDGYENLVTCARRLRRAEPAATTILDAPSSVVSSLAFRCRVLLPLASVRHDIAGGMELFRSVRDCDLDPRNAEAVAQFLNATLHYNEAAEFLGAAIVRYLGKRRLVLPYLIAKLHSAGVAEFHRERERLLKDFGDADAMAIIRALPRNLLSGPELRRLIDYVLVAEQNGPRRVRELVGILHSNTAETAAYLRERLRDSIDFGARMFGRLLMSQVADVEKVERANLGDVCWRDFEAEARALSDDINELFDQQSSDDSNPLMRNLRLLRQALDKSRCSWPNSAECYFDAASFAHWFYERLKAAIPTSVIRLGDGEGNFLPYPEVERPFQRDDQTDVQQNSWWGARLLSDDRCAQLSEDLIQAVSRADALGLPPAARLLMNTEGNVRSDRGIRAIMNLFAEDGPSSVRPSVITSCHIHTDLDSWDLYRQIFRHVESVSTVSCHDLAGTLAEQFGIGVRRWHTMPGEKRLEASSARDIGESASPLEAFERIMSEIDPLPGELFLVAAGFLGKLICDRIRSRGGIALDIGSTADYWMGFQTRGYGRNQTIFDPSSSLIDGQPFIDRLGQQSVSRTEPCRSNLGRDKNLTGQFSSTVLRSAELPTKTYSLRLIGHPRCGSAYAAQVLQRLGVKVGHERLDEHGICSWMHTVDDLSLPYAAPIVLADRFQTTMAFMRNPLHAIPSIMLENARSRSFDFRRFHILRLLGTDIAQWRTPIERAIASYVGWVNIVERQSPAVTLRVEHIAEDLRAGISVLNFAGHCVADNALAAIETVPKDMNSSTGKFPIPKPSMHDDAFHACDGALLRDLDAICLSYGYPALSTRA